MRDIETQFKIAHMRLIPLALALCLGCGEAAIIDGTSSGLNGSGAKDDSGWLGPDSYEVGALVRGVVVSPNGGDWDNLETDTALQTQLVDSQLKFLKNAAEDQGWRFNQLADTIEILSVEEREDGIAIAYVAVIDMLGRLGWMGPPRLEQLDTPVFAAKVPSAPMSYKPNDLNTCAEGDDSHSVRDYNFHYYFDPTLENCAMPLTTVEIEITEVFDRPKSYPEYDQLLNDLDNGAVGFKAALVPNRGDNDPSSRFDSHAKMLEQDLGLTGVDMDDGAFRRYVWNQNGATMIIDLYDPTEVHWSSNFSTSFRKRLSDYTLVHYNGHSSYGSKHLLDNPESYKDGYQIISMHSCQSYAYYTRQVFRAKATATDPSGFANADVIATGKSSYPSGAPPTMRAVLTGLMKGMGAVLNGRPEQAPDWLSMAEEIESSTYGDILYGLAGVRTNVWNPISP